MAQPSPHSSVNTGLSPASPLSRRARWLAFVPLLAAAMLLIGTIAQWVSPDIRATMLASSLGMLGQPMQPEAALFPTAFWPTVFRTVPVLIFAGTMLVLYQLFRRFTQGSVLDARNAQLVSRAGLGFILFALAAMVANTLTTLVLSMSDPSTPGVLTIGFTTSDIGAFAAGFAFWGLGLVLGEAARIANDHASIV